MNGARKIEKIDIPLSAGCREILNRLSRNGRAAYIVGGCVRDSLLGRTPHDWDVATAALPDEVLALFPGCAVHTAGLRHGTVALRVEGEIYEVTTFRMDGTYSDLRRPDRVVFTDRPEADLARRDFTVNAMAYREPDGLLDPFGGREDLARGVLRCVGDPRVRFTEDALRLLRGVRFAAELGFSIAPETRDAMRACCGGLQKIAVERIFEELTRTVTAPCADAALRAAPETLFAAVPELSNLWDVPQNSIYHIYNVWEHTLHALAAAPRDKIVRLAVLFHDVGKRDAHTVGEDGRDHFYGHASFSAKITDEALARLKAPHALRREVTTLVRLHDTKFPPKPVKLRRMLAALGYETFYRLLAVSRADSAAHAPDYVGPRLAALDETEAAVRALQAENICLSLDALQIGGEDLLTLGFSGPAVGDALREILADVVDGRLPNDRDALLRRAERIRARQKDK